MIIRSSAFPTLDLQNILTDNDMISYESIFSIFENYLNDAPSNASYANQLKKLIKTNIKLNKKLWDLEDSARFVRRGLKPIARIKKEIDRCNQMRNENVSAIDKEFAKRLKVVSGGPIEKCYAESPGMLIDRIAILHIRMALIKQLLGVMKEADLVSEYKSKEKSVVAKLDVLGGLLDLYLNKIARKEMFFIIYEPVKIYNDKRVRKYIRIIRQGTNFKV